MSTESNKIIVKVGKKSKVKFSHSKVFRAVTVGELDGLTNKYDDCHIVVIEGIYKEEEASLKKFVGDFKARDNKNEVLFFIPDNDEITQGIADELDYSIYLTLGDLYTVIYNTFGINVSTLIDDKKRLNSAEMQESIPDGITDIFGGLDDSDEQALTETLESVSDDMDMTNDSNNDIDNTTSIADEIADEITKNNIDNNTESISDSDSDEITRLKIQLRDAKYDYSVAVKDMKTANTRIESLENIIKSLKDEKDSMLSRFNELVESADVLEDPIPLEQYNRLNEIIEENENKIKELSSMIESLKNTIKDRDADIDSKVESIEELRKSIEELKSNLSSLNESIESGDIHKDIVEEYTEKINEINNERDKLVLKLNEMQSNIEGLHGKIEDMSVLADTEAALRINTFDKLKAAIDKIVDLSDKLNLLKNERDELQTNFDKIYNENKENSETINTLKKEAVLLKANSDEADKRIELATKYSEEEKSKLEKQLSELKAKLSVTEQQLNQKEAQYIQLVTASGMDANGASALVETNKTLEGITKTLREQLGAANKENESLKRKVTESNAAISSYKSQVNQLSNAIKDVASNGGGGVAAYVGSSMLIKPINYTGKATIIPIFGSGSYGITTTAMSLATKLGATSRVLYLDFDIVSPRADAWFNIMPLCRKVPGINPQDRKMTGLGIFYELGIQVFQSNFENIINNVDKTKGGGIDYLSGVYYRVDTLKLATSAYTELFNFLASKYQYIIVDLGRLGNSDINDRLIKIITDITDKSVCVTTSDRFDIRTFKTKLVESSIDVNRIAWLINMCSSTNIDEKTKDIIKPAQYGIVLTDTALYGARERFTRNKLNKDKFELFINSVLFSSRR